jgi:hypothetical protein
VLKPATPDLHRLRRRPREDWSARRSRRLLAVATNAEKQVNGPRDARASCGFRITGWRQILRLRLFCKQVAVIRRAFQCGCSRFSACAVPAGRRSTTARRPHNCRNGGAQCTAIAVWNLPWSSCSPR